MYVGVSVCREVMLACVCVSSMWVSVKCVCVCGKQHVSFWEVTEQKNMTTENDYWTGMACAAALAGGRAGW